MNCTTPTRHPCPSARSKRPKAAVDLPLPRPVWMISSPFLIVFAATSWSCASLRLRIFFFMPRVGIRRVLRNCHGKSPASAAEGAVLTRLPGDGKVRDDGPSSEGKQGMRSERLLKAAAAPATVSGEQSPEATGLPRGDLGRRATYVLSREPGDLPSSLTVCVGRGAPRRMLQPLHAALRSSAPVLHPAK